jgi:hypothetical protein
VRIEGILLWSVDYSRRRRIAEYRVGCPLVVLHAPLLDQTLSSFRLKKISPSASDAIPPEAYADVEKGLVHPPVLANPPCAAHVVDRRCDHDQRLFFNFSQPVCRYGVCLI